MSDSVLERPAGRVPGHADRIRRLAVAAVFATLGFSEGTWAARIPAIKAGLHLSPGLLGLALLGPAVGCVLALPATGAVLASVAPRRVAQAGLFLVAVLLPVTTVTSSAWQLFLVLLGWGVGIAVLDVAMNTEASAVQDHLGRRLMSGFHGAYSVGGLAGSGLGAITAATGLSARTAFLIAAVPVLVAGVAGTQAFAARAVHHTDTTGRAPRWPQWSWALVALGVISFASFLGEGAAGNWSAVYLHSSLGASAGVAALGYSVFAITMTAGRVSGDWLTERAGPVRLVRLAGALAAVGFGGALLIGHVWSGLAGFALLGAGLAVVVPLAVTAAARLGRPGPSLAFTTSFGYLGALAGPAIIGGLADLTSLPVALGVIVVLSALIVVLAGAVRPRPRTAGAGARLPEPGPIREECWGDASRH
jgi:MFS family permease